MFPLNTSSASRSNARRWYRGSEMSFVALWTEKQLIFSNIRLVGWRELKNNTSRFSLIPYIPLKFYAKKRDRATMNSIKVEFITHTIWGPLREPERRISGASGFPCCGGIALFVKISEEHYTRHIKVSFVSHLEGLNMLHSSPWPQSSRRHLPVKTTWWLRLWELCSSCGVLSHPTKGELTISYSSGLNHS